MKFVTIDEIRPFVKEFCSARGYDEGKLKGLCFGGYSDFASLHIPSDVVPDGLMNDLATQPKPILIIARDDDSFVVEETEYTEEFFRQE